MTQIQTVENFNEFVRNIDEIRLGKEFISNSFKSISELQELFEKKYISAREGNSLFLLNERYDYLDIIFFSVDFNELEQDLHVFLTRFSPEKKLRIWHTFASKEEMEKNCVYFERSGFKLIETIGRYSTKEDKKKNVADAILSFAESVPKEISHYVGVANLDDALAIQKLLLTEFDPIGDSLPTLDEIKEHIQNENIFIVKSKEGELVCLSYFEVKRQIYSGIYDVTLEKYRQYFPWFLLQIFAKKYFREKNIKISRAYGWKNLNNKKLVRKAKDLNQQLDRIRICVFSK